MTGRPSPPATPGRFSAASLLSVTRHYQFIDYATQGYLVVVGALILFLGSDSVTFGAVLLAAHAAGILGLHALITAHRAFPDRRSLGFLRHFYPILMLSLIHI